jgi:hypothetical protein
MQHADATRCQRAANLEGDSRDSKFNLSIDGVIFRLNLTACALRHDNRVSSPSIAISALSREPLKSWQIFERYGFFVCAIDLVLTLSARPIP